jgi:hypothetical protein
MTAPWYWLAFPAADAVAIVRGHNIVQAAAAAVLTCRWPRSF